MRKLLLTGFLVFCLCGAAGSAKAADGGAAAAVKELMDLLNITRVIDQTFASVNDAMAAEIKKKKPDFDAEKFKQVMEVFDQSLKEFMPEFETAMVDIYTKYFTESEIRGHDRLL